MNSNIKSNSENAVKIINENDSIQNLQIINLQEKVDSLTSVIEEQGINEKYYSTALSSQTAIYSTITGGLFLLIGFITYVGFKRELVKVKRKYNESQKRIQEIIRSKRKSDSNLYSTIGLMYEQGGIYGGSITFYVKGLVKQTHFKKHLDITLSNLETLKNTVSKINNEKNYKGLVKDENEILKNLGKINHIKDKLLLNKIAELRINIAQKIEEAKQALE